MAKKKKKLKLPESSWIDTYADTITLLMTFFVLLYSMSSVDSAKFQQISQALNSLMTGNDAKTILEYDIYQGEVPLIGGEETTTTDNENQTGENGESSTYDDVKKFVDENDLSSIVSIISDKRGVIIQIKDSILFETGQADLKDNSKEVLDKINALIATLPNNIIIEGHTDNVPINTYQFPSNYELSGARASRVLRYFVEEKGQDASRFVFQGLGDTEPLYPNDSEEHKALNRRVNILIVANNEEGK
ncbi:OmpA family protein [Clostridium sp. MSJ-8]|uniref:flagellar motor protein MotB n=1 Tax=Clostridium sp. MSJ-8 TaxID=2841510 RepID=UPI001C0F135E|nr:flagellar motor protein MotB [Clostridium sp. MSJ-8]MBU5488391.1 OmpA family protein [Clostridium sp. MSJ-8]